MRRLMIGHVRLTTSAAAPRSVLNIVRTMMACVSAIISATRSIGSPRDARPSHRSSICSVQATIASAIATSRWRWNAGCASRRCRSQNASSLVSSPLPRLSLSRS